MTWLQWFFSQPLYPSVLPSSSCLFKSRAGGRAPEGISPLSNMKICSPLGAQATVSQLPDFLRSETTTRRAAETIASALPAGGGWEPHRSDASLTLPFSFRQHKRGPRGSQEKGRSLHCQKNVSQKRGRALFFFNRWRRVFNLKTQFSCRACLQHTEGGRGKFRDASNIPPIVPHQGLISEHINLRYTEGEEG